MCIRDSGKILTLNGVNIADPTAQTIGPEDGTGADDVNLSGGGTAFTLGSAVLNSSLTTVGTLTGLRVTGDAGFGNTNAGTGNAPLCVGTASGTSLAIIKDNNGASISFGGANQPRVLLEAGANSSEFKLYTASGSTYASAGWQVKLQVLSTGAVVPGGDNTQDLGSSSARWANLYTGDLQRSNEGSANEVDGTWGQYTIQEGEEDLFLINRRNGKKYKFNLTEVQ